MTDVPTLQLVRFDRREEDRKEYMFLIRGRWKVLALDRDVGSGLTISLIVAGVVVDS